MSSAGSVSMAVAAATDWLDSAATLLNPEHNFHHSVTPAALLTLWSHLRPPPALLRSTWAALVWPQPDEPVAVYVLRCLAHQEAITGLVPYCVPSPSSSRSSSASCVAALSALSEAQGEGGQVRPGGVVRGLQYGVWRVVGLRLSPHTQDLVQTGWHTALCALCQQHPPQQQAMPPRGPIGLPLLYGGTTCPRCDCAYPRQPRLTRRTFLVIEDEHRVRHAALLYGDGAIFQKATLDDDEDGAGAGENRVVSVPQCLSSLIGQVWRVHFYITQTELAQPLRIVHAAVWSSSLAFAAASSSVTAHSARTNYFLDDRRQRRLWAAQHLSFAALAECVQPTILGQSAAKRLVLLSVVHTLYRSSQPTPLTDGRWAPLHLLLVGPSRSGRSSLLAAAQTCYGALLADRPDRAQRSQRRACRAGAMPLESHWPWTAGDVLMAGAVRTVPALLLDDLDEACGGGGGPDSGVCPPPALHQLLTRSTCGISLPRGGGGGGGGCAGLAESLEGVVLPCSVQLTATAHEESRHASALAQAFPLVVRLSCHVSLADSVVIGHNVVARSVSLARHSQSRSGSRVVSLSPSPSARASVSASMSNSPARGEACEAPQTLVGALDAELLHDLIATAPDPTTLLTHLPPWMDVQACLLACLCAHAGDLEEATRPPAPHLPPPATLRGTDVRHGGAARSALPYVCATAGQVDWEGALRMLSTLLLARVVLEAVTVAGGAQALDADVLVEEVWQCYAVHLRSRASLLREPDSLDVALARGSAETCGGAGAGDAALSGAAGLCGGPPAGLKRPRSRKASKLLLLQLLQDQQRAMPAEGVVAEAHVAALYASLGGLLAMGDPLDVVLQQLQHEGLLLRRPGGWKAICAMY